MRIHRFPSEEQKFIRIEKPSLPLYRYHGALITICCWSIPNIRTTRNLKISPHSAFQMEFRRLHYLVWTQEPDDQLHKFNAMRSLSNQRSLPRTEERPESYLDRRATFSWRIQNPEMGSFEASRSFRPYEEAGELGLSPATGMAARSTDFTV
jgi:hypothetical protein